MFLHNTSRIVSKEHFLYALSFLDIMPIDLEVEIHSKIDEYISLYGSGDASSSFSEILTAANDVSSSTAADNTSSDDDETQDVLSKSKRSCH